MHTAQANAVELTPVNLPYNVYIIDKAHETRSQTALMCTACGRLAASEFEEEIPCLLQEVPATEWCALGSGQS